MEEKKEEEQEEQVKWDQASLLRDLRRAKDRIEEKLMARGGGQEQGKEEEGEEEETLTQEFVRLFDKAKKKNYPLYAAGQVYKHSLFGLLDCLLECLTREMTVFLFYGSG